MSVGRSIRGFGAAVLLGVAVAASAPVALAGTTGIRDVTTGAYHACALRTDGTVWCSGDNGDNQVGDGTDDERHTPVQVMRASGALTGVIAIDAGEYRTCAVRSTGSVYCWGENTYGSLGDDSTDRTKVAVRVVQGTGFLADITAVSAGCYHTCALRSDRTVWCWGQNGNGQLGRAASTYEASAVQVQRSRGFLTGVKDIGAGGDRTCAARTDGSARCWGKNEYGQPGDGLVDVDSPFPRIVRLANGDPLAGVRSIEARHDHACVIKTDATVRCWGKNADGQLGNGTSGPLNESHLPVRVRRGSGYLTDVKAIGLGQRHSCAVTTDALAWCWGDGGDGALGIGPTDDRTKAVRVWRESSSFTGIRGIDAGAGITCAHKALSAWCWGCNGYGAFGNGSTDDSDYPVRMLLP